MNAQDEEDFVFACLLGAYIQSLRQQEEGQQQLQRGNARVQQSGRRRRRRMRRPRSMVREWLSEDRRQQPGNTHASRPTTDRLQVLLRPITYCHVLLRSPRFTTAY